jgi:beta-glucosidase-like glycosyl hydrolase
MMDTSPAIERLGIPQFQWWNEALHGVARNGFATVFPITTMMASTWDDELVYRIFSAVSDEARAKAQQAKKKGKIERYQSLSFWTPNINIFRDPRWGRGQETYGEDPYLTEQMGLAVVNGLQGQPYDYSKPSLLRTPKYRKLLACAKHFAVHSGPEYNRHSFDVQQLPARDLWETYLPAFKALVQKGKVAEVMCAYQSIDEHYRKVADDMAWGRDLFKKELGDKPGFKVYKSVANFILIKYPTQIKDALQKALAAKDYKIKFMTDKGLEDCLRITLGRREQVQTVVDTIKLCFAESKK